MLASRELYTYDKQLVFLLSNFSKICSCFEQGKLAFLLPLLDLVYA